MEEDKGFYWERHAEAERFCLALLDDFKKRNSVLARFEERLIGNTSTGIFCWVDHFIVRDSKQIRGKLEGLGFVRQPDISDEAMYHPGALLPGIVLSGNSSGPHEGVALRVDSIPDFLQVNGFRAEIEGGPLGPYRRAIAATENGAALLLVERRATSGYEPSDPPDAYLRGYLTSLEHWQNRPRTGSDEDTIWAETFQIANQIIADLGPEMAAHIVCRGERNYWLSRNFAGRVQQARQETLGLGWANQDHLTFRSSRRNFSRLVNLFSVLGFRNRERFYAGKEAGWGAQLMENPVGLTLFLDVDLASEEMTTDFSRDDLQPFGKLGTVGLWCALHGDSIFQSGLHHLAGQFSFERLISDLAKYGVEYMAPFSNFPYLRQAFSVAERWDVDPARVEKLVREKSITAEQEEKFLSQGAVGSHLENIERHEGYKGFNKKNVSAIIRETDPRK